MWPEAVQQILIRLIPKSTEGTRPIGLLEWVVRNYEKARKEEIAYFKKLGVYKKVEKSKCLKMTGKQPLKVRW